MKGMLLSEPLVLSVLSIDCKTCMLLSVHVLEFNCKKNLIVWLASYWILEMCIHIQTTTQVQ